MLGNVAYEITLSYNRMILQLMFSIVDADGYTADGGPRTPDESADNSASSDVSSSAIKPATDRAQRKHSYNASSSEYEDQDDIQEDLGKVC